MDYKKTKIVLSGAYGMGNIGDESICETIARDLLTVRSDSRIDILAWDEKMFAKNHRELLKDTRIKVRKALFFNFFSHNISNYIKSIASIWSVINCDYFVWGGGALIKDNPNWTKAYLYSLRVAQLLRKDIIIAPIGINVIKNPETISLTNKIKHPQLFSARDRNSKKNLLNTVPKFKDDEIVVVPDPVFHLGDYIDIKKEKTDFFRIGINLASIRDDSITDEELINIIANFLIGLKDLGKIQIIHLPTVPSKDSYLFDQLLVKLGDHGFESDEIQCESPLEYLNAIKGTNFFIGTRLHSIILASNINKLPMVGIIYEPKTSYLKDDWGLDFIHDIKELKDIDINQTFNFDEVRNESRNLRSQFNKIINK